MVKEHFFGKMAISMKENGKMEEKMAKEHSLGPMGISMKENGRMIKGLDWGQTLLLMVKNM